MLITDLKYQQKRNSSEVSVVFEDGSAIALDAEVAVRFHVARGMQVSAELLEEMRQADENIRARKKLIQYLALRKKSSSDARLYLKKAGFSPVSTDEAIATAHRLGYLNDVDFAEAFARTHQKIGKKGPRAVTAELQARGINRDEAQRAVASMAEPETQMEMARKLAAKKYPILKDQADQVKASRKLAQHLARRGFDPDICDRVTREFFGDPTVF